MSTNFETEILNVVKAAVEEKGSITQLAKHLGTNKAKISKWINGISAPGSADVAPIIDMMGAHLVMPDEKLADYDLIPKVSALAGAGALSLETSGERKGLYAFRKDFLAMQCISAKNSVLLDVTGDSMEPLLKNGDTILVDQSDRNVSDGGIYLVTLFESLLVKQIVLGVRSIILHSLNPMYPDTTVGKEDIDSLIIHGRMRWAARCF